MPRLAAAIIAALAWAGLVVQFEATLGLTGSPGESLWVILRYFTILTNLLVALVMTALALGRRVAPFMLGGVTIAIVLVGAVYMLLLRGLVELSGGAILADTLLHKIVPILVPLYWLAFAPKGELRWGQAFVWSLYPLAYFAYALVRGAFEGRYAYPFIDVAEIGYGQTVINAVAIAAGFVAAGLALVGLDDMLASKRTPR
jgi:hypothetical protein